jgi:hypothetical protein
VFLRAKISGGYNSFGAYLLLFGTFRSSKPLGAKVLSELTETIVPFAANAAVENSAANARNFLIQR